MKTDHLLPSQVNSIFSALAEGGFNRNDFAWTRLDGEFAGFVASTVPGLLHTTTEAVFAFAQVPPDLLSRRNVRERPGGGEHWIRFSPGHETPSETHRELTWQEVTEYIRRWAGYIKREMDALGLAVPAETDSNDAGEAPTKYAMSVESKQQIRDDFLDQLYQTTSGNPNALVNWRKFVTESGLPAEAATVAIDYLRNEGYLRQRSFTSISITHQGVLAVEERQRAASAARQSSAPNQAADQQKIPIPVPPEIQDSLKRFREDHAGGKTAFVMMQFGNSILHNKIIFTIRSALRPVGISVLRADDKEYHDDLFPNILTYIHGCTFGIAVFERIESDDFNPNVSLEVGYMFGLRKPVCLLKDRTLNTLHTDIVGRLYREFDPHDTDKTIPDALMKWLSDRGFVE